jgi:hypothetical protein
MFRAHAFPSTFSISGRFSTSLLLVGTGRGERVANLENIFNVPQT